MVSSMKVAKKMPEVAPLKIPKRTDPVSSPLLTPMKPPNVTARRSHDRHAVLVNAKNMEPLGDTRRDAVPAPKLAMGGAYGRAWPSSAPLQRGKGSCPDRLRHARPASLAPAGDAFPPSTECSPVLFRADEDTVQQ